MKIHVVLRLPSGLVNDHCLLLQVQASHDQVASKLSLAEMQLVELQAKRLEGLQVSPALSL